MVMTETATVEPSVDHIAEHDYSPYRDAATLLWGQAGAWSVDEFARLNREYFADELPPLPIVIGIMPGGKCRGVTHLKQRGCRHRSTCACGWRISLASNEFVNLGAVSDTLLHECLHVALALRGQNPEHNGEPWCSEINRLSAVLGLECDAAPVKVRRVPNPLYVEGGDEPKTVVTRAELPGQMPRWKLGSWPHSVRPGGYHEQFGGIDVDIY